MWIPRWLGEIYSKLYYKFSHDLFTLNDAHEYLRIDKNKLMIGFSYLHKAGALLIFSHGKPRTYRLMKPQNFILIASENAKLIDIKQERYLNLIYDFFRSVIRRYNIKSYAVYGSVARGNAGAYSDVDILIISDDFRGSISSRLDELYYSIRDVSDELDWLIDHNIYTNISVYPLTSREASRIPLLFLDISFEAKIVYDDGFLKKLLDKVRGKLMVYGAKKIELNDGRWYWDLKPNYKLYELIEL